MLFFEADGLVALVLFAIWIWAIFDVIATTDGMARNLPKGTWLFLVIILPDIGAVAWMALGRPLGVGWRPGDTTYKQRRRSVGLEDRASWNSTTAQQKQEYEETERRLSAERDARRAERLAGHDKTGERSQALQDWEADLLRREQALQERARADRPEPGAEPA